MTTALATAANPNPASFSVLIPLFAVGVALVLGWAWWVRSINLALGLASTVAMWTLAYVALLQPGFLAGELLFAGMVLCLVLGGARAARLRAAAQPGTAATHAHGLRVGLVSATVNLMVLGMFLRPEQGNTATQAALYASGLFAGSAILGWVGDIIGQRMRPAARTTDPSVLMAAVLTANILVMVVLGGLVTSLESGLAVPDWPNSFGHNMLLYPLSAMKGGIFYEHAHRLFGMLVGVTTLCTWMVVFKDQKRMLPRALASLMVVLVITQGWLGGLSVTGNVTTSMNPADLAPNVKIRVAHAMLGQSVFAIGMVLAFAVTQRWATAVPLQVPGARSARALPVWALACLIVQLFLGACVRLLQKPPTGEAGASIPSWALHGHITMALIVATVAILAGLRCSRVSQLPWLQRTGKAVMHTVGLQMALGIGALVVVLVRRGTEIPWWEYSLTTAHQATGALLLGLTAALAAQALRFVAPAPQGVTAPAAQA